MDMNVEIQVTQLLTWNFARSVIDFRYFQVRNQRGTLTGAKSFLWRAQTF